MFLQGRVEGFSFSIKISWEWPANLGISRNHRIYLQPGCFQHPNPSQSQLGTSSTARACSEPVLLFQNWECSCEIPPTFNYSHSELKPIDNSEPSELSFLPHAMKRFSKGWYRSPQFPQKNVLWHPQGSSFILKVNHSKAIQFQWFLWVIAVGQCCPTPLRLSELANAIFICLCSCCTADTDNTSVVFSASTHRELAHLNNP